MVGLGDFDNDGIVLSSPIDLNTSGTIRDVAGNNSGLTFTPPSMPNVDVDGIAPSVTAVLAPANATYIVGETLQFTVSYSENVNVSGTPRLDLTVGATTRYATYQSGDGSDTLIFEYVIVDGDTDTNGIAMNSPIDLNSGSIDDGANNAELTYTPPVTTGVLVDGLRPYISFVTDPADATYLEGQTILFVVNFDQNVVVSNLPFVDITVGSTGRSANYISGSGTQTVAFGYVVPDGDNDNDGIVYISPLDLNVTGTINDVNGNTAALTFSPSALPNVRVDTTEPLITAIVAPADATYSAGQTLIFTISL